MNDTNTNTNNTEVSTSRTGKPLSTVLVAVVVLAAVVAGAYFYLRSRAAKTEVPSQSGGQEVSENIETASVNITSEGFVPSVLRVKSGTVVTFVNQDEEAHAVASNPYPINDELPGFDSEVNLETNGRFSFTFDKVGEWGYHDNINPDVFNGMIIVEE